MTKYINKTIQKKARNFEKQLSKQKWEKLVETLEASKLEIKEHDTNVNAMMIGVKGIDDMDIEVYQNTTRGDGVFATINLWYHPHYTDGDDKRYPKSVFDAIDYINNFADAIKRYDDSRKRRNK